MPVRPMKMSHANGSLTTAWTSVQVPQGIGQFFRLVNLDATNEVHVSFNEGRDFYTVRASDPPLQLPVLYKRVYLKSDATADYSALLGGG